MNNPYRNYDPYTLLNESASLNKQQALTARPYEKEVLKLKRKPMEAFGPLGEMRAAGMLQFNTKDRYHPYFHAEMGDSTVDFDYAAVAVAPAPGANITVTITGPYGRGNLFPIVAGMIYRLGVGINATVVSVTATPGAHTVVLNSHTGVPFPALPAGKAQYIGTNLGESQYADPWSMMPSVVLYDHIPERKGWAIKMTNFAAMTAEDALIPPKLEPVYAPWRPNMKNSGWIDSGFDGKFDSEILGLTKNFYYAQRSLTPRTAGDKFYGDGLEACILSRGITTNLPGVVTRQFFIDQHMAKIDVENGERDIRYVAGMNVCTKFNEFVSSEMNGSFLVDRMSAWNYEYKGFDNLVSDSTFTWYNNKAQDDLRGMGSMGGRDTGYAIQADLPDSLEYTGGMARKPNASMVMFRPANSQLFLDGDNIGSFMPIHYAPHAGSDFVKAGEPFQNRVGNDFEVQFSVWLCNDFRKLDLCMLLR